MSSDAMRQRPRRTYTAEFFRQPVPPMRWAALADWRQMLPCLEPRAHRYAPIAEIWLPALLAELSDRLDQPLGVTDDGTVRTITALGFVRYVIDRQARTIASSLLVTGSLVLIAPEKIDVVCAWQRYGWLGPLLGELPAMRLTLTLLPDSWQERLKSWLVATLTPMLRRDPRLHRLRRELRQALCFDTDLFRLTLRTRSYAQRLGVRASHLMDVWQHAEHLKVVEQDAPRLLPLAYEGLDKLAERPAAEALKTLKSLLRPVGLTDTGWRYLLKHGSRVIDEAGGGRLTLEELARLAQAFALAGGHPPPSPALHEALRPRFLDIAAHGADHEFGIETWLTTEPRLAAAILKAANAAKRTPAYGRFIDDVAAVLWWMRDAKVASPRKSLPMLIRMAKDWESDQLAIARTGLRRWSRPRSVPCGDGVHEAALLDGPVAVLEEARAMRNCLRARLPALRSRKAQVWLVRDAASGSRVALVELRHDDERWRPADIAARFNRPAPAWVATFAETLAVCETLRTQPTGASE